MTLEEIRLKYRRRLLGLASSLVVDTPATYFALTEGQKATEARGQRVMSLEQLGRDIDVTIDQMIKDILGESNGQASTTTSRSREHNGGSISTPAAEQRQAGGAKANTPAKQAGPAGSQSSGQAPRQT